MSVVSWVVSRRERRIIVPARLDREFGFIVDLQRLFLVSPHGIDDRMEGHRSEKPDADTHQHGS
jgi:hypothetical protein